MRFYRFTVGLIIVFAVSLALSEVGSEGDDPFANVVTGEAIPDNSELVAGFEEKISILEQRIKKMEKEMEKERESYVSRIEKLEKSAGKCNKMDVVVKENAQLRELLNQYQGSLNVMGFVSHIFRDYVQPCMLRVMKFCMDTYIAAKPRIINMCIYVQNHRITKSVVNSLTLFWENIVVPYAKRGWKVVHDAYMQYIHPYCLRYIYPYYLMYVKPVVVKGWTFCEPYVRLAISYIVNAGTKGYALIMTSAQNLLLYAQMNIYVSHYALFIYYFYLSVIFAVILILVYPFVWPLVRIVLCPFRCIFGCCCGRRCCGRRCCGRNGCKKCD